MPLRSTLVLLLLAGCSRPDAAEARQTDAPGAIDTRLPVRHTADRTYTLVNREEPRVDTLEVAPGARALSVALTAALSIGQASWEMSDADGRVVWTGTTDTADTTVVWQTSEPRAGTWHVGVTPTDATGGVNVHWETR